MTTEQTQTFRYPLEGKYFMVIGAVVGFLLAFGLAFTPLWYLSILAALLSGYFFKKSWQALLVGAGVVCLGWGLYVIIKIASSNIEQLFNQVAQIIIGQPSTGWVLISIILVIGVIFGILGGVLGSAIRNLWEPKIPT